MMRTVLVVDDSLTIRMDLSEALQADGFTVLACDTASAARAMLARERIDAVILDVVLPDGDGVDLLAELREMPQGNVPVVLLSTEAEVRSRIRGLRTGADEYVGKPYDKRALVSRIRALVNSARRPPLGPPVLVIDDSETARAEMSEMLRANGFRVVTAASGEEGLLKAAVERPAAVIVDGVMPGIDGATVIRRMRFDAALRRVPCLLVTAETGAAPELRALESGADAFVHKGEDHAVILAKLRAALRGTSDPDEVETKSWLSPKRILAVDDSATYREHVAAALRDEGYEVIAARSGEEALELLAVQPVDCVLLDLVMPGIDGYDVCRRLKQSAATRDLPVVVLTEREDRASMLEGLAEGADDYIHKSADLDVVKARLRVQLRKRQLEDETRRVREQLLKSELEAAEARAARELAAARAVHVQELEQRNDELTRLIEEKAALAERYERANLELERANQELERAYHDLSTAQIKLVHAAKMASLGELVAGVAHEINNPLAFVLSHLQTVARIVGKLDPDVSIERRPDVERAQHRIAEMRNGLERIRDLIVKLRTFSRLDEGERKVASVSENVQSVLTILAHRIRDGVRVETRFGDPDLLDCYPALLNQALMNVVTNALDAMEADGTLAITTGAAGDQYVISVRDTGKGIPPELRERVLDPFVTTKPVGQGTGLGLSITDSIIRKHGGALELIDAEGGGTEVLFRLPLTPAGDDPRG